MSEVTVDSYRLGRFVAGLACSTMELQDYLADPGPVMEDNGLTAREQELLTQGSFQDVLDYLWEVGPKPGTVVPPPDPPDGGG